MASREQTGGAKHQRVLACVLCQQRKVKCDRKFPCANCSKSGTDCVPAAALTPRQRRRRFPERELLDRVRHYEHLLCQNNVRFEPLHYAAPGKPPQGLSANDSETGFVSSNDAQTESTASDVPNTSRQRTVYKSEAADLWRAISRKTLDSDEDSDDGSAIHSDDGSGLLQGNDDSRERVIRKAWDRTYDGKTNDHLLFASPETNEDLSSLHPEQVQIFRLWQVYLENVEPLLKVTHAPALQVRMIEAASKMSNISPGLEALMFGIYCISVLSLDGETCLTMFGLAKGDLLPRYQFGCRRALQNCRILCSGDHDSLIALYLYLLSVRPATDPRSLSSMLGVAIRIAKRIGIHSEASNTKCTPFEAETRRRLWWSLVIFDNRMCEMYDYQNSTLSPAWDCSTLLNVNDFELRPDMKVSPQNHEKPSEAIFAVVRSEMSDYIRYTGFHLDFVNPYLKDMVAHNRPSSSSAVDDLSILERRLEDKYLVFCNPEIPLQFVTIWMTRGQLAKARLLEFYSKHSKSAVQQTDDQRNTTISYALRMLECDTMLFKSPLIAGFRWLVEFYFPFPAYLHVLQDQKKRPDGGLAERAWNIMSENYEARISIMDRDDALRVSPILSIFCRLVLKAWEAREAFYGERAETLRPPLIVTDTQRRLKPKAPDPTQKNDKEQLNRMPDVLGDDSSITMTTNHEPLYKGGMNQSAGSTFWTDPILSGGPGTMDLDLDDFDWTAIDWNSIPL